MNDIEEGEGEGLEKVESGDKLEEGARETEKDMDKCAEALWLNDGRDDEKLETDDEDVE